MLKEKIWTRGGGGSEYLRYDEETRHVQAMRSDGNWMDITFLNSLPVSKLNLLDLTKDDFKSDLYWSSFALTGTSLVLYANLNGKTGYNDSNYLWCNIPFKAGDILKFKANYRSGTWGPCLIIYQTDMNKENGGIISKNPTWGNDISVTLPKDGYIYFYVYGGNQSNDNGAYVYFTELSVDISS